MSPAQGSERALAYKYEAVFCLFLAVLAYLGRESADLVYPTILYLFLMLLCLNFSAILSLRLWPSKTWLSALIILANCGVITGILSYSGGPDSNLWVLYLLPIYTVSLLLGGREVAWITAGAVSFNTLFYVVLFKAWDAADIFALCIKNGLFIFSAALTWRLSSAERRSLGKLRRQREELERLEETTRARTARDEQTQKLAEVGLISAGIVHDLKNPLTIIHGFAEVCLQDQSLDSAIRMDIESIKRTTLRCQDLVAGILGAAGKEERLRVSCEIHEIVESAVGLCGNSFERAGIGIRKRFDSRPLHVSGDPGQLQRLFINLIDNAIRAMPSGGTLTIETQTDYRLAGSPRVRVLVEDTGAGISDEALAKLFKPFSTTRALAGGTGLGLFLCRDIALKHGGGLQAENSPSGGARFTLSLPLQPDGGRETVLVVDDEPAVRRLAERVLRQHGYGVLVAADGEEGVRAVAQDSGKKIRLVITDMVMPKLGGRRMAETITDERPDLKFIYASSYTVEDGFGRSSKKLSIRLLPKPYTPQDLARSVREALDG